jgi:hypothetical protein
VEVVTESTTIKDEAQRLNNIAILSLLPYIDHLLFPFNVRSISFNDALFDGDADSGCIQ